MLELQSSSTSEVCTVTFPPPIPPKSKRLLETYRQRNKGKLLYENVKPNRAGEIVHVNCVSEYDIVQFKGATIEGAQAGESCVDEKDLELETHDGASSLTSGQTHFVSQRMELQNELEKVL